MVMRQQTEVQSRELKSGEKFTKRPDIRYISSTMPPSYTPRPSKNTNTAGKSSDRRLAAGRLAAAYLHSAGASGGVSSGRVHKPANAGKPSVGPQRANDTGKTVKRVVGSKSWEDASLLEWDPKHFRLFVGNLGEDATDQILGTAFEKYETLSKVKVPVDNRTGKNKGYGFVAFVNADDYFRAFKEMNGKYVGLHPVQLKRAETAIKPVKKKGARR